MFMEVFWGALLGLVAGKLIWRLVEWYLNGHFREMGKAEKRMEKMKADDMKRVDRRGRREVKSELLDIAREKEVVNAIEEDR